MKGMQSMQEKMLDQGFGQRHRGGTEEEETVRVHADLHVLPEWSADSAPVDFSDWLLLVSSQMSDLSSTSSVWWDLVVEESRAWYRKHQTLKPLEKLRHLTKPSVDLQATKWKRLEKRASTFLLKAIPEQQKEDLVASKDISVMNILCRLMLCYQPGGSQEKQAVLSALESPSEANSISEAITGLKKWLRWKKVRGSRSSAAGLHRAVARLGPTHGEGAADKWHLELPIEPVSDHIDGGRSADHAGRGTIMLSVSWQSWISSPTRRRKEPRTHSRATRRFVRWKKDRSLKTGLVEKESRKKRRR